MLGSLVVAERLEQQRETTGAGAAEDGADDENTVSFLEVVGEG